MVKFKGKLFIIALIFLGLVISSQAMAAVCNVPSVSHPTIQAAVSDPTCDPINVGTGTYNENIVINRALTLIGAGSASTFINGVNTGINVAVVNITAAGNVTLSGFTITNAPVTNDGDLRFGVLTNSPIPGVTYAIVSNKVVGTNDPDAYEDYGIYGQNGGKENLLITNNVVTQTGSNNIVIETHQGKTDISYNSLDAGCYGIDAIFVMTHSGKDVSNLQKVHHNTIDMGTGVGVGLANATGITFAAVAGYYGVSPARFLANSIEITNNSMFNLKERRRGIGLWNDATVGSDGNIINPTVLLNTVTGAPGTVTASMGIYTLGLVTNALITNNNITGVDFSFKERSWNGHIATGTQLNQNNFSNNSTGVLTERSTGTLNAENNWWGCAAGPGNAGCDNVSSNVDYTPWLTQPVELIPLTLYWKDYNGEDIGGYMPDIDQNQDFDLVQARTEQTGPQVLCGANWLPYTDSHASGGSIKYSDTATDSCTFTFIGTSIRYIATPSNNKGIAEVYIDGQYQTDVDLYSPTLKWQQVLYTNNNLTPGQHTITILVTGMKNPSSSLHRIDVDAFDVDDIEHEYCAPVAEANSLWWLDKKYDLGLFDIQTHTEYVADVNEDGSNDIKDLVQELALLMGTNVGQTGTTVEGEQHGIDLFLTNHNLTNKLYEHTVTDNTVPVPYPDLFHYIEAEVERSQDVKLDLGFWHVDEAIPMGNNQWLVTWSRRGGHAVTVAGVDSQNFLLAISDPDNDAAENGGLGVIRPVPSGHLLHPNDPSVHNNEANASHDIYTVGPSPSPGGKMGLLNFPWKWNLPTGEWETVGPVIVEWPEPLEYCMTFTEIEAAVIVSPIICGNGNVDPGEECDDGNLINGDGCSSVCIIEFCGDGILQQGLGEQCDDGNNLPGDGCNANCIIEFCGDGIVQQGLGEQCDDGNANNNDGCRNNCMLPVCGDSIIDPGETCDPPQQPGPNPLQPGICRATCTYCGDGIKNNAEACDDGNGVNNNGCTNSCTLPAVTCSFTPTGATHLSRGSNLNFLAAVQNDTDQVQVFQFASKIILPNGNTYPSSGWLLGPITVTLNPHTSTSKNLTQFIPYNAPFGTYTYRGYVGKVSPTLLYNQCEFNFSVNP